MKKLFLLDAFALIYRAHYAFVNRPLVNSKGQNVSAITGFVNSLLDILENQKPSHLAVAFDLPSPTFRHEEYPEYKANREEQPEDITWSISYIKNILKAMNIPIASAEGYEADDVVGTLAKQAEKEGFKVFMMTPDKDFGQLVSPNIFLYKPARMGNDVEVWGEKEVLKDWGIKRVEQVIDMLGLQGDTADNIPGVKGVGPKTAQKLLEEYDSVENLLENIDKIKGRTQQLLINGKEQAILSKKLATISLDVPIKFEEKEYICENFNEEELLDIFNDLEFSKLTSRVKRYRVGGEKTSKENKDGQQFDLFGNAIGEEKTNIQQINNATNTEHSYILLNLSDLPEFVQKLGEQSIFCFDTETTGLNLSDALAVGISFSWEKGKAYYLPLTPEREKGKKELAFFKDILEDKNISKIGQNIKFDILLLRHYDINLKGELWDTMLMHYILEPEQRHNMDYLARIYLNYETIPITDLLKGRKTMDKVPLEQIKEYAAEDADITWQLYKHIYPILKKEEKQLNLYQEIEAKLIPVLVEMEYWGVKIDKDFLNNYALDVQKEITKITEKIYAQAERDNINLDSPKQIGELLFGQMKLGGTKAKKTKSGQYSTGEERLEEILEEHPIVQDILDYRQLAKLLSTYIKALPELISPRTGRIHSSFNQALVSTGRLSSQNPNLQNIPIRSSWGKEIRKAFIPEKENWTLLAADYSQIELRLIAEISKDENMLEAFKKDQDIHQATAARVYHIPLEEVSKEQRYNAKTINFSIIYGAGATNISKNLGISRKEASELIEQYFTQYPGIKKYMTDVIYEARKTGFVSTIKGRKRKLREDLNSRNSMVRSAAERNAINSPIQGSAADMIKIAMIDIFQKLKEEKLKTRLILQVHDELVFEVPNEELEQVKKLVEKAMTQALPNLQVPIKVSMGIGENWLEAH